MNRPSPGDQADALEQELSEDDRALLDKLAEAVVARRLTAPALFFLESMKPLGWVGSQALIFFRPIMSIAIRDGGSYDRLTRLLERRGSVELLLRRLEAKA